MEGENTFLFLCLVFGAVFLLANSVIVPTFGAQRLESKRLRQRMDGMLEGGQLDGANSLIRQKYLKNLSPLERALERLPGIRSLEDLLEQAGEFYPGYRLAVLCLAVGFTAAMLVRILSNDAIYMLMAAVLSFFLPLLWYRHKASRRLEKFEEQLPDALEMMCRALRAGHPLPETLRMVAGELSDPISKEFGMTFDEINYGVDIRIAFQNMLSRVPSLSLVALVTSVVIQRESGGNLAEVLQKISSVIRSRFRFHRRVRTLTAEGRMSAWVLAMIPLVLFAMLSSANPEYLTILFTNPTGKKLLYCGIGLGAIGALWVRKLLRIEI